MATNKSKDVTNFGLISEWYDLSTDYSVFLNLVQPGDRLEFDRSTYYHWAVYVGIIDDEPTVVHRANPDTDSLTLFSRSGSKGASGMEGVVIEALKNVWATDKLRINNQLDYKRSPFSGKKVVQRMIMALKGEAIKSSPYNPLSSNCEHFASWARNNYDYSSQDADSILKKVKVFESKCMNNEVTIEEYDKNLTQTTEVPSDNEQKLDQLSRKLGVQEDELKRAELADKNLKSIEDQLQVVKENTTAVKIGILPVIGSFFGIIPLVLWGFFLKPKEDKRD